MVVHGYFLSDDDDDNSDDKEDPDKEDHNKENHNDDNTIIKYGILGTFGYLWNCCYCPHTLSRLSDYSSEVWI